MRLSSGSRLLFISIILMYISICLIIVEDYINFDFVLIRYPISIASFLLFFLGIVFSTNESLDYSKSTKLAITLFLLWNIIIIVRGIPQIIEGNYSFLYLKRFLTYDLLIYTFPFILVLRGDEYFIGKVLKIGFLLSLLYVIITLPFLGYFTESIKNKAEYFVVSFASSGAVILLTLVYHSKKVRGFILFEFLLALFVVSILARRNQVVYVSSVIIFSLLFPVFFKTEITKSNPNRQILRLVGVVAFVLVFLFIYSEKFNYLRERIEIGMDSRREVISEFKDDFNETPKDWIWGRGINGEYRSKSLAIDEEKGTREGIENGYLNHVLKGGYLYIALLTIISLKAIWLGLFKSANYLSRAFAAIIIIYFIDMVGFGIPSLSIKYLMVWISISFCLSERMRKLNDGYLLEVIRLY